MDETGCSVIKRGVFVASGIHPTIGEENLHLYIEGNSFFQAQPAKERFLEFANKHGENEKASKAKCKI
jgi:hypothetical protein